MLSFLSESTHHIGGHNTEQSEGMSLPSDPWGFEKKTGYFCSLSSVSTDPSHIAAQYGALASLQSLEKSGFNVSQLDNQKVNIKNIKVCCSTFKC